MEEKQQLIKYLADKYEALDFWESLKDVKPGFYKKIELLESEIAEARKKLLIWRSK
jgi:hypothetical protein